MSATMTISVPGMRTLTTNIRPNRKERTTSLTDLMRGLRKACLEVAYDNGMIDRYNTEEKFLEGCDRVLEHGPLVHLMAMDAWLLDLSDDEFRIFCVGEYAAANAVRDTAPTPELAGHVMECVFDVAWTPYSGPYGPLVRTDAPGCGN